MSRVVRSARSLRDVEELWRYIANDDPAAATRQVRRIDEKLRFLAGDPLAGTPRAELGRDLRSFAVGNYLIFYRPISGGHSADARAQRGAGRSKAVSLSCGGGSHENTGQGDDQQSDQHDGLAVRAGEGTLCHSDGERIRGTLSNAGNRSCGADMRLLRWTAD